jgi:hypothetical protein
MSPDTFENLMAKLQECRPFQVFTVQLKSGERHEIDSPGSFAHRDGTAFFYAPGKIPVWFDHDSVMQIIDATSSEYQSTSA